LTGRGAARAARRDGGCPVRGGRRAGATSAVLPAIPAGRS